MHDRYAALILDLDGVVTDTARVHQRAWKQLFDEYLRDNAPGAPPFSAEDYRELIDGRLRIDGTVAFLSSRDITLPIGAPGDPPTAATAWGLANRKNELFVAAVRDGGVDPFPTTFDLLRRARAAGSRTALVSASRNAELVLAAAHAGELFDVRVDGVVAEELALAGKPDPATYLEAARRLGASPGTCVVVEDAVAGVEAGRRGRFGLVIGVDRTGHADDLRAAGADLVVRDLADVPDEALFDGDPWVLAYRGFDPMTEGQREALLTVGNGYMATRGAMVHAVADTVHYPGTYVAGTYDRLVSNVDGRRREDESMVNLPNWTNLTLRCDGGSWLAPDRWSLAGHRVSLDLRTAVLERESTLIDPDGRRTRATERRFVSMDDPHAAALEIRFVPENWSGRMEVRSIVDGNVTNANVAAYRMLADRHLGIVERRHHDGAACLVAETVSSHVRVAVAIRTNVWRVGAGDSRVAIGTQPVDDDTAVGHRCQLDVAAGETILVEKLAGVVTSRDDAIAEPALAAIATTEAAPSFEALLGPHLERWVELWHRFRIELEDGAPGANVAVRVHVVHLLQALSPRTAVLDAGVPPRGLHGEGYRGHVFWDELFVFPLLDYRLPELTRSLLLYRVRRLPTARRRARERQARGALFPWQSGSDGREETPRAFFNPRSGRWMADNSCRQYHVNLAIAFNVWQHWQVTGDLGFLVRHGAELLIESARFFSSFATYDADADRFDVRGVMGPDEFHDGYPDRPGAGIDNNSYVNVMAAWALARAEEVHELLGPRLGGELLNRLGVTSDELERWGHVSRRLRVPFLPNGLLAQFEGYERLRDLDLAACRDRYGDIGRLDLILEAEGDSTNNYQVSKQADVLMLFYLFTAEELTELFPRLGYDFDPATIPATVDYYLARTSHGSTLSRIAHSWVLARTDRARSWRLLQQALEADLRTEAAASTREGIHIGAMAGSLDLLERCYTGLEARNEVLTFNPLLPDELSNLVMELRYRNHVLAVHADHDEIRVASAPGPAAPITIGLRGVLHELAAGSSLRLGLRARARSPRRSSHPSR